MNKRWEFYIPSSKFGAFVDLMEQIEGGSYCSKYPQADGRCWVICHSVSPEFRATAKLTFEMEEIDAFGTEYAIFTDCPDSQNQAQ